MPLVRRAVVVSAAAAVVVAVTGCTGSSSPTPTGTSTWPGGPTTTTSTPSTTTSSPTTTATSDLATRFPKTKAGAEGFVKYLFEILNASNRRPDPSMVEPLVDQKSCSDCEHWVSSLRLMAEQHERFLGDFVVSQDINAVDLTESTVVLITQVVTPAGKRVDAQGRVVHVRESLGPFRYDLRLEFRGHWVVTYAESVK